MDARHVRRVPLSSAFARIEAPRTTRRRGDVEPGAARGIESRQSTLQITGSCPRPRASIIPANDDWKLTCKPVLTVRQRFTIREAFVPTVMDHWMLRYRTLCWGRPNRSGIDFRRCERRKRWNFVAEEAREDRSKRAAVLIDEVRCCTICAVFGGISKSTHRRGHICPVRGHMGRL